MNQPAPQPDKPNPGNSTDLVTSVSGQPSAVVLPTWLATWPWLGFALPLLVFMALNSLEPAPDKPFEFLGLVLDYSAYPLIYTIKIALCLAAMAAVLPVYRQFPRRLSLLAPLVGVVGVVLWVGICKLGLENTLLVPLGLGSLVEQGRRAGFNPLAHWPDRPGLASGFLAVRLFGLAVVVPIVEEFFLRGLAMRFVITHDWWKVPFGTLTPLAIAVGTLLPVLMHPGEMFAAAVWFTLVTWLMFKTKNIWDCVVAHAVTNLLLGIYVVVTGEWQFL